MSRTPTPFAADVYRAVTQIPKGKVATYSQIALMSGHRGAARAVGNALHVNPFFGSVPCHRVVNASGALAPDFAFGGVDAQRRLLEGEGVVVKDGKVDLEEYQWIGEE
ncbi:MAG: MGMT family protein [Clostridiales bacterium]|nr:MGMT family protein [Clostridiales bacterium]